jgi:TolB protein
MLLLFSLFHVNSLYAQQDTREVTIPGTIAYIGLDQNLYSFNPTSGETIAITDDAFVEDGNYKYYTWPTWSTDGRLAYFAVENDTDTPIQTQVYVSTNGIDIGNLIYTGELELFNYASWAPENCSDTTSCRALSVLLSGADGSGLFVEVIKDQVAGNPAEVVGRGGPFYFSWSPDGESMLWQRDNRRMDVYNLASGEIDLELTQSPGAFQAPDWSPIDDRLMVGVYNEEQGKTEIVIVDETQETTIVDDLEGLVSFTWSPDGAHIAYVDGNGPLVVLDSNDGETVARTVGSGVGPFFWSPDGQRVAYITLATAPDSETAKSGLLTANLYQNMQIAWSVLDVTSGDVKRFGAFTPTRNMVYMFTYFDQFAQSHSVWSPDSRYIVYSEVNEDEVITNVLDTIMDNTVPLSISDGTLAVWSFN